MKDKLKIEINKRAREIKKIYQQYLDSLKMLEKRQFQIIENFIKKLEERKIKEIKKDIEVLWQRKENQ